MKTTALHNAAYAVLVSRTRQHSQNARAPRQLSTTQYHLHHITGISSLPAGQIVLLCPPEGGMELAHGGYLLSGLGYNRYCVLGSATRVYYVLGTLTNTSFLFSHDANTTVISEEGPRNIFGDSSLPGCEGVLRS